MPKKIGYIIIAMVVILVVVTAVAFVVFQPKPVDIQYTVGVKSGDTFTYSVKGFAEQYDSNEIIPASFYDLNRTDYVKVTITNVAGPNVTFSTLTRYINGTQHEYTETLNVIVGNETASFWGIFASNLKQGDLVRALKTDGGAFNSTETRTYASGDRETNRQTWNKEYYNAEDTTQQLYRNRYVYVDQATGMMVELKNIDIYTSPQIMETIEWHLIDSNVFTVSS
ncbi:MAG: hypothetical protein ACFCUE_01665 [Candidatus Bathyarchaeia archaeon]|jgi:hypothetical protein